MSLNLPKLLYGVTTVSIETVSVALVLLLFGMFCNVLLFRVSIPCIFKDVCQLLD